MSVIGLADQAYGRVDYESEADLEDAIIKVEHRLCGSNRFNLDVKNKIGTKASIQNIPDGYLPYNKENEQGLFTIFHDRLKR